MEYPVAVNLQTDTARVNALVSALGHFLARYLSMRFRVVDMHKYQSPSDRLRAFRMGRPLHELIDEDNDLTLQAALQTATLAERCQFETQRSMLENFYHAASAFCRNYNIVLLKLNHFCRANSGRNDCIHLKDIAAPGDSGPCMEQNKCFFVAAQVDEDVETGYLTKEIAVLLEPMVDDWVSKCESKIKQRFKFNSNEEDELPADRQLALSTKRELSALIIKHVSMMDQFDEQLETRPVQPLDASRLEQLCKMPYNSQIRKRCEEIRSSTILRMRLIKPICKRSMPDHVEKHCAENADEIVQFLRCTPKVLRERPGFSHAELHFEFLESIVKRAALAAVHLSGSNSSLVTQLLNEWRDRVGQAALSELLRWVDESCAIMEKQVVPESGFLPTLCCVRPPAPPWRTSDETWYRSDSVLALMTNRMQRSTGVQQQYLPIPNAVHVVLRLVSIVWELIGHRDSYEAFFSPGEMLCSIVRNAVLAERITLQNTSMTLINILQNMAPGASYRRAVEDVRHFRKDPRREVELRTAMQHLSKFPLHEIVTAAYESSTIFDANQSNMLNCAASLVPAGKSWHSTWIIRRALQSALPIICQLRREITLSPYVGVSRLGEALVSIPAVREWNASTPQLIITHEMAKQGISGIVEAMKHLSKQRHIVRYGRLPPSQRGEFGSKSVFTINAFDLAMLLGQSEF
jgi:hypothetical protein